MSLRIRIVRVEPRPIDGLVTGAGRDICPCMIEADDERSSYKPAHVRLNYWGRVAWNDFAATCRPMRNLSFSCVADCRGRVVSPTYDELISDGANESGEVVKNSSAEIVDFKPYLERRRRASGSACGPASASHVDTMPFHPFMWAAVPVVFVVFQPAWMLGKHFAGAGTVNA